MLTTMKKLIAFLLLFHIIYARDADVGMLPSHTGKASHWSCKPKGLEEIFQITQNMQCKQTGLLVWSALNPGNQMLWLACYSWILTDSPSPTIFFESSLPLPPFSPPLPTPLLSPALFLFSLLSSPPTPFIFSSFLQKAIGSSARIQWMASESSGDVHLNCSFVLSDIRLQVLAQEHESHLSHSCTWERLCFVTILLNNPLPTLLAEPF